MKRIITIAVALSLVGCATCERHPIACTAAVAFVAGSIAIAAEHDNRAPSQLRRVPDLGLRLHDCTPTPHGDVELSHGGCP